MEQKDYTVDIVILSWNRSKMTIETILNILAQKNIDVTLWIIDQGSKPKQLSSLQKMQESNPAINIIKLEKNIGVAAGRKLGMSFGTAEFIVGIDNDAIFASNDSIYNGINRIKKDIKIGAIGFKIENFYTNSLDLTSWVYPRQLLPKKNDEFFTTRFCGAGHLIRRSALNETDSYDDTLFFYWEELDLSYQLIQRGFSILYFPEIKILHKISVENRVDWKDSRYYYFSKNAIYINWKYFRSLYNLFLFSTGYILKGIVNKVLIQAFRGVFSGLNKITTTSFKENSKLSKSAKRYIYQYDTKIRGSIISRFRNEVLEILNKR